MSGWREHVAKNVSEERSASSFGYYSLGKMKFREDFDRCFSFTYSLTTLEMI